MARAIPVLPLVASRIVRPGTSCPAASAASIIRRAGRSLTEPPGLLPSNLPSTRTPGGHPGRPRSCTSGVFPMASSKLISASFAWSRSGVGQHCAVWHTRLPSHFIGIVHPIAADRSRWESLAAESAQLWQDLRAMQRRHDAVSPAKIGPTRPLSPGHSLWYNSLHTPGGCSSMVEHKLPKLDTGVRFPSPALSSTGLNYPVDLVVHDQVNRFSALSAARCPLCIYPQRLCALPIRRVGLHLTPA